MCERQFFSSICTYDDQRWTEWCELGFPISSLQQWALSWWIVCCIGRIYGGWLEDDGKFFSIDMSSLSCLGTFECRVFRSRLELNCPISSLQKSSLPWLTVCRMGRTWKLTRRWWEVYILAFLHTCKQHLCEVEALEYILYVRGTVV